MAVIMFLGCKKENSSGIKQDEDTSSFNSTKINSDKIPLSVEKFNNAVKFLLKHSKDANARVTTSNSANLNPLPNTAPPTANYLYVRFKPTNEEQLHTLTEGGCNFELYEEPLHDENFEFSGDDYLDPNIPSNQFPWFYTCVPVGYPLPSGIQSEVLQQLFLFNEFADEPADIEDSWGGEPEDKPDSTEGTANYRISQIQSVTEWMQQNENPVSKATQWVRTNYPNISISALYYWSNVTTNITDPGDPLEPCYDENGNPTGAEGCGTTGGPPTCPVRSRYYPQGTLRVQNTSNSNSQDALKGVKVRTRHIFKLGKAYTNNTGWFKGNKGYKYNKKVRVIVKFKNKDLALKVRGITEQLKFWQLWLPVKHKFSKMKNCDLENIAYTFNRSTDPKSQTTRKWAAATMFTARYDMQTYCTQAGIQSPPKLRVWLSGAVEGSAATPMLNYTISWFTGSTRLNLINFAAGKIINVIPVLGTLIYKLVELQRPDMIIRLDDGVGTIQSRDLYGLAFHETAHAIHFAKMYYNEGKHASSEYWADNIFYTISNGSANPYGTKTLTNNQQRTALIEAWAYYTGNTFNSNKYNEVGNNVIRDNEIRQIERQIPVNNIAVTVTTRQNLNFTQGWIPYGLMHDVTDAFDATDNITNPNNATDFGVDNVNTYSMQRVLQSLTNNTVTLNSFKLNLLNTNSQSQATDVNNLVRRYGY